MNSKKAIYALGLGLLLTGCANQEEPVPGGNGGEGNNGGPGHYVNISIVTDACTRAASDFQDGTGDENKIDKVGLYFFSDGGNCEFVKLISFTEANNPFSTTGANAVNPAVEKLGSVEVELEANGDYHSVVAILNPDAGLLTKKDNKETLVRKDFEELQAYRASYDKRSNGFTISNSVYYEDDNMIPSSADAATGASAMIATPIQSTDIYVKENVTDPTPSDKALEIYVERNVAKVSASLTANAYYVDGDAKTKTIDVKSEDGEITTYTVVAEVKGIGLTVLNEKGYALKNVQRLPKKLASNITFDWNDFANKRSYWETTRVYNSTTDSWGDPTQVYTSWKSLADKTGNTASFSDYINPNTLSATEYDSDEQDNCTKLIVCAQLKGYEGTDETKAAPLSMVRFSDGLWTEAFFMTHIQNRITSDLATITLPASWTDAEKNKAQEVIANLNKDNIKSNLTLTSKNGNSMEEAFLATVTYNGNKNDIFAGTGITDDLKNKLKPVIEQEIDNVIAAITDRQIEYWKNGMTYFYVPIQHTGFSDLSVTKNSKPYTYLNGVVRNHVYDVTIKSIVGLGTPVIDETKRIDPERPQNAPASYLNAKINVLKWKISKSEVTVR